MVEVEQVVDADVASQMTLFDAASRQAAADGFPGLRVVSDLSGGSAHEADQRVRWELLADGYMASGSGMSAMCLYRACCLPRSLQDEIVAVHPHGGWLDAEPEFRLFHIDDRLVVAGFVDSFASQRLARLLQRCPTEKVPFTLDVSGLEFIDGRASVVLEAWLRQVAGTSSVRLVGTSSIFRRVWEILGFSHWLPPRLSAVGP